MTKTILLFEPITTVINGEIVDHPAGTVHEFTDEPADELLAQGSAELVEDGSETV
jgi:hypothetical protein